MWGNFHESDYAEDAKFLASLKVITDFHESIGYEEIVEWASLSNDAMRQRCIFSNGASVEVDFSSGEYSLAFDRRKVEGKFLPKPKGEE